MHRPLKCGRSRSSLSSLYGASKASLGVRRSFWRRLQNQTRTCGKIGQKRMETNQLSEISLQNWTSNQLLIVINSIWGRGQAWDSKKDRLNSPLPCPTWSCRLERKFRPNSAFGCTWTPFPAILCYEIRSTCASFVVCASIPSAWAVAAVRTKDEWIHSDFRPKFVRQSDDCHWRPSGHSDRRWAEYFRCSSFAWDCRRWRTKSHPPPQICRWPTHHLRLLKTDRHLHPAANAEATVSTCTYF